MDESTLVDCVVLQPMEYRRPGGGRINHKPGQRIKVTPDRVDRWATDGLIRPVAPTVIEDWPWGLLEGCQLNAAPAPVGDLSHKRVVACLNIWNDLALLEQNMPTWLDHVDHVVAVDGPYAWDGWHDAGVREPYSTDGTIKYLEALGGEKCTILSRRKDFWPDQLAKRNAYIRACRPGDLLFVVDGDEAVNGAECLRGTEGFDVGWVRVEYDAIYKRRYRQPRVFLWQEGLEYRGRHHWLYVGDELLTTHQYAGAGWDNKMLPLLISNQPGLRPEERQSVRLAQRRGQVRQEAEEVAGSASDTKVGARESLRILQLTLYDAGMVVYRLHTAINTCTPHSSIFGGYKDRDAYNSPLQYDVPGDMDLLRHAVREADVIHCHLSYHPLLQLGEASHRPPVIIHHHGTMLRKATGFRAQQDATESALRLVSNLELLNYGNDLQYLPNPVPVSQYKRLAAAAQVARERAAEPGPMVVGHSPSKQSLKGTLQLRQAVQRLKRKGLKIRMELISGASHQESLLRKAACDVCFDSFWLGMQCSGLEQGAMGQPVLAGTEDGIHDRYIDWVGAVPYTEVNSTSELEAALERLYLEPQHRAAEGARVQAFIERYHDYPAVALQYLELLDGAIGWRDRMTALQSR